MRIHLPCAPVMLILVAFGGYLHAQTVVCSVPYEDDCSPEDYENVCGNVICIWNEDYDPEDPQSYPLVCPDNIEETEPQQDPVYHLGLEETTWEPGYLYWSNQQTLCYATRACDEEDECFEYRGFERCPANPVSDLWTPHTELFYVGVEGEECYPAE